jgi:hypothetical protein
LFVEPVERVGKLLAFRLADRKVEQKAARDRIGDPAVELTEFAEIRDDALADPADHRHRDHHLERRNPAGPARELAPAAFGVDPVGKAVPSAQADIDGAPPHEFGRRHDISSPLS